MHLRPVGARQRDRHWKGILRRRASIKGDQHPRELPGPGLPRAGLPGRAGIGRPVEQHGARAAPEHLLGHAAEEHPPCSSPAVGGEDDQTGPEVGGMVDDAPGHVPFFVRVDMAVHRKPGRTAGRDRREVRLRLRHGGQVPLPVDSRRSGALHDVEEHEARSEVLGEGDCGRNRGLGQARAIKRHQQSLESDRPLASGRHAWGWHGYRIRHAEPGPSTRRGAPGRSGRRRNHSIP